MTAPRLEDYIDLDSDYSRDKYEKEWAAWYDDYNRYLYDHKPEPLPSSQNTPLLSRHPPFSRVYNLFRRGVFEKGRSAPLITLILFVIAYRVLQ